MQHPWNAWHVRNKVPAVATHGELSQHLINDGDVCELRAEGNLVGVWGMVGSYIVPITPIDLTVIPSGDPGGVLDGQVTDGTGTHSWDGTGLIVEGGCVTLDFFEDIASCLGFSYRAVFDVLSLSSTDTSNLMFGILRAGGVNHQCFGMYRTGGAWLHGYKTNSVYGTYAGKDTGTPGSDCEILCQTLRVSSSSANSAITHRSKGSLEPTPEQYPSTSNAPNDPESFTVQCLDAAGSPAMQMRLKEIWFHVDY